MDVEQILSEKGKHVTTISPDRTLLEVAEMLSQHRIGALVVTDGSGSLAGILTERDVVRAIGQGGSAALEEDASAWMTRKVTTCGRSARIDEIMSLMTSGKFRHVPVVEDGRLEGIISIGDVVKHRLAEVEAEHRAMRDYITAA